MLVHFVQFRFKAELAEDKQNEILDRARRVLPGLPGVQNLLVGKNIRENEEFPFALSMYFENEAALVAYRDHPDHVKFRDEDFYPVLDAVKGMDYAG